MSKPTDTTAGTPRSNLLSETSKERPVSPTYHQGGSGPTPPGSLSPPSPITSTGGSRTSAESNHPTNSPSEPPSATGYSAYPHGWSTTADDTSCAYPPNGPGPTPTTPPSPTSATYPNSPDRHPHNHTNPPLNQPLRNRTPTRPDTPPKYPRPSTPNPTTPPNPHQPPTNPQNNPQPHRHTRPTTPPHESIGGFRLRGCADRCSPPETPSATVDEYTAMTRGSSIWNRVGSIDRGGCGPPIRAPSKAEPFKSSFAACCARAESMSANTTESPRSPSNLTVSRPIPPAPPTTRAVAIQAFARCEFRSSRLSFGSGSSGEPGTSTYVDSLTSD